MKLLSDFHTGFSDVASEVLQQIAEGELSWTGVHTDRYEDGKLVESWVDWDKYQFLAGLDLLQ